MYASYKDQVEFIIVYVREAHPEMLKESHPTGVVGRPKDIDQRVILASECVTEFKFTIPMVIDGMDGQVNEDYKAAPVRVAITDLDGKIVYYAGRGPRDFKLSAVERVLKRLVANQGHVPPPPEPRWGPSVQGLRCGIGLDPPNPRIGDDVVMRLQFNNPTEHPVGLIFSPGDVLQNLTLTGGNQRSLTIEPAAASSRSRRSRGNRRAQVYEIKPGDSLGYDLYGNLKAPSDTSVAGTYQAQFSMTVDADRVAQMQEDNNYKYPLVTGEIHSGETLIEVGDRLAQGCADCHGKTDYHHVKTTGCEDCHTGQVGEDNFATRQEVCSQCHPRARARGRRQILGRDGEFNQTSRHRYGKIEDSDCLTCHNAGQHKNGTVSLLDPASDEGQPWQGTGQDFCLSCHAEQPLDSMSFPEDPKGSGYDKTRFAETTHARWLGSSSCAHCHVSHGSANRALLRGTYVMDPKQVTDSAHADYGLCWTCHDPNQILTGANAFDKLHSIHVKDRGLVCATCHDVHGPTDQDEAGLIKFRTRVGSDELFHFTANRNEHTSFEIDVHLNQGSCAVSCHKDGTPRTYVRDYKKHSVTCLNCH
ncbi:MAG: hypothetical protein GY809_30955 [Planctomycetes bacterium]|nr:hypothetical protein [Planctomycetota bacterium]